MSCFFLSCLMSILPFDAATWATSHLPLLQTLVTEGVEVGFFEEGDLDQVRAKNVYICKVAPVVNGDMMVLLSAGKGRILKCGNKPFNEYFIRETTKQPGEHEYWDDRYLDENNQTHKEKKVFMKISEKDQSIKSVTSDFVVFHNDMAYVKSAEEILYAPDLNRKVFDPAGTNKDKRTIRSWEFIKYKPN